MRDLFEVSTPGARRARRDRVGAWTGVYGARLTGAGFGGCTVNLVRRDAAPRRCARPSLRDYGHRTGLQARVFEVEPSRGATVLRG